MHSAGKGIVAGGLFMACAIAAAPQSTAPQRINLAERLTAGTLRAVNREVTPIKERPGAIHLAVNAGGDTPRAGVAWIDGSDFAEGTIEVDIRGRDEFQRSFVGIAFHRKDDDTYECVYLRPFNFRAEDPVRRQHAVQYMASPDYDWPRLRKEFPEEFENPVDQSLTPTDWLPLKVVAKARTIEVYVGPVKAPTLEVRKLGQQDRGMIGLWTGNNSVGDFANLRITHMK